MIIYPNVPSGDLSMGNKVSPEWNMYHTQTTQALQQNFSSYLLTPGNTTTNINKLDTIISVGALIYDQTTNELKVNINGTWRVVQVI